MQGTIIRKRDEGYGFIKPADGQKDVFFHASSMVDTTFEDLNEGDSVTYELTDGPKGPAATNVVRTGSTTTQQGEESL